MLKLVGSMNIDWFAANEATGLPLTKHLDGSIVTPFEAWDSISKKHFNKRRCARDFYVVFAGRLTQAEIDSLSAYGFYPRLNAGACLWVTDISSVVDFFESIASFGGAHPLAVNIFNELSPICREALKKFRINNNKVQIA